MEVKDYSICNDVEVAIYSETNIKDQLYYGVFREVPANVLNMKVKYIFVCKECLHIAVCK